MKQIHIALIGSVLVFALAGFKEANSPAYQTLQNSYFQDNDTLTIDPETGLIEDKNLKLVKAQCTGCHSTKLIGQHRFTREGWVRKIRWMQQYHNLWNLGESEKVVLDYLEKYYSPESTANKVPSRRQPLKDIQWYKL